MLAHYITTTKMLHHDNCNLHQTKSHEASLGCYITTNNISIKSTALFHQI